MTTPPRDALPFRLDRTITIAARPETVFAYFTDPTRFAAWWGAGSTIDARPGGEVRIVYPGGAVARGEVVEVEPPRRVVFTYGYDRPDAPIPPGGSRVTVTIEPVAGGCRVTLRHDVASEALRDQHVDGWRYQMAVFGHVVAAEEHAAAAETIDRWFAAWAEPDGARRRAALDEVCAATVEYRDRFGVADGLDDLDAHVAATQRHGLGTLERDGEPRVAAGVAVVAWRARRPDGEIAARGTTVLELGPACRIVRVTGLWA